MRVLTGCSGVGAGFELACLQRKLTLRQLIESDRFCQKILRLRYPDVPLYKEMRTFRGYEGEFDLCCFSPPCQPFSIAGHRQGRADERDLFSHVLRIVNDIKPKYFAIENVPGILSCPYEPGLPNGSYFRVLRGAINELGYKLEVLKCNSALFGAPWLRERILFVAIAERIVRACGQEESWHDQARRRFEDSECSGQKRGVKSPVTRSRLRLACGVDRPVGVPSGDRIIRERRAALGNALDPRVAAIAIDRILYWESLHRIKNQIPLYLAGIEGGRNIN